MLKIQRKLIVILSSILLITMLVIKIESQSPKVKILNQVINSRHSEYTPFITPDEKYLIFESNRPGSIGGFGDFDLWIAQNKTPETETPNFEYPVNLGKPVNSSLFDGLPSLKTNSNGNLELYFTSLASATRKGPDLTNIYYSEKVNEKWEKPKLVELINSNFHDRMPSISADGNYLYFSSNRPGGFGNDDIWVSQYDRKNKKWMSPKNLGNQINTTASETTPSIHNDTITLYFSSDRDGGKGKYDIYVTQQLVISSNIQIQWKIPKNLGSPYNSIEDDEYPTVIRSGKYMYFSSNRKNGFGHFDIYRAQVPNFAKPKVIVQLSGMVHEESSLKGIEANIRLDGEDGFRNISTKLNNGKYNLDLINDKTYTITITAPGYKTKKFTVNLKEVHIKNQKIIKNIGLSKIFYIPTAVTLLFEAKNKNGILLKPNIILGSEIGKENNNPHIKFLKSESKLYIIIPNTIEDKIGYKNFLASIKLKIKAEHEKFHPYIADISFEKIFTEPFQESQKVYKFQMNDEKEKHNIIKNNVTKNKYIQSSLLLGYIFFKHNSSNSIYQSQWKKLKQYIKKIRTTKIVKIELHGHTDSTGTKKRNNLLSAKRALFIKKALISSKVPQNLIKTFKFADSKPLVKTKKASMKNRRVELYLFQQK